MERLLRGDTQYGYLELEVEVEEEEERAREDADFFLSSKNLLCEKLQPAKGAHASHARLHARTSLSPFLWLRLRSFPLKSNTSTCRCIIHGQCGDRFLQPDP